MPEVPGLCHLSLSAGDSKKIVPAIPLQPPLNIDSIVSVKIYRMPLIETESPPVESSSNANDLPDRLPFPPVTYSHILHCSYHDWHARYALQDSTFSTIWTDAFTLGTAHLRRNLELFPYQPHLSPTSAPTASFYRRRPHLELRMTSSMTSSTATRMKTRKNQTHRPNGQIFTPR